MTRVFNRPIGRRAWAAALAATLLLGGCASLSGATPEEQVTRLAQKRWDALIQRNFDAAYDLAQPGFRAVVSREAYKKRFGDALQWKSVQIHDTTCEAERCTVRIRLTSINHVPGFARSIPEITGYFDETWIRDDGSWWFYESF
jgi:hypothetical protein